MSYNKYGSYGYSPYFDPNNAPNLQQPQQQQGAQEPRSSVEQSSAPRHEGYLSPSSSYAPYFQSTGINHIYPVAQTQAQQSTLKYGDNGSNTSSLYPSQDGQGHNSFQPRSATSDVRNSEYPQYQRYDDSQRESQPASQGGTEGTQQRYGQSDHYYTDASAPGTAAHSPNVPASITNIQYSPTDTHKHRAQAASQLKQHAQAPMAPLDSARPVSRGMGSAETTASKVRGNNTLPLPTAGAARAEPHSNVSQSQKRQLSHPSEYRVNYPAHTKASAPLPRYPSPQQAINRLPKPPSPSEPRSNLRGATGMVSPPNVPLPVPSAQSAQSTSRVDLSTPQSHAHLRPAMNGQIAHSDRLMTQGSTAGTSHQPTTVDPSQIFDQAEYQRRMTGEAENTRRAKEKENAQLEQMATSLMSVNQASSSAVDSAPSQSQASNTQAQHTRTASASREQLQAEMRAMIDRMREFKSKDPTGFSEIWEQFKKVQPPPRAVSQTPQAQPSKAPPPVDTNQGQKDSNNSPALTTGSFPSPTVAASSAPDPIVIENLPDLGKFPYMRRRRPYKKDKKVEDTSNASDFENAAPSQSFQSQGASQGASGSIDPALLDKVPSVEQTRERAMQDAMRQFNQQAMQSLPQPVARPNQSINGPASAPSPYPAPAKALWPVQKRPAIAELAKRVLEADAKNRGKTIAESTLLAMLENDPTYDNWCEMIRKEGFVVHRSKFAKIILNELSGASNEVPKQSPATSAVPKEKPPVLDLLSGSMTNLFSQTPANQNAPFVYMGVDQGAASQPVQMPGLSGGVHGLSTSLAKPYENSEKGQPPAPIAPIAPAEEPRSAHSQAPLSVKSKKPAAASPAIPLTKGQMAKKRDFSEIVDLSQEPDSESEDEPLPPKRQDTGTAGDAGNDRPQWHPGTPMAGHPGPHPQGFLPQNQLTNNKQHPPFQPLPPPAGSVNAGRFDKYRASASASDSKLEALRNEIIAEPLNHKRARRTSTYNPTTLARDVLIAKGAHPTERALNFHLVGLVNTFKHVHWNTDLSTIRWDLIDPAPPQMPNGNSKEQAENEEADEKKKAEESASEGGKLLRDREFVQGRNAPLFQSILERGRGKSRGRRIRGNHSSPLDHGDVAPPSEETPMQTPPSRGFGLVSRSRGVGRGRGRGGGRGSARTQMGEGRAEQPSTPVPSSPVPSFTPINKPLQQTMLRSSIADHGESSQSETESVEILAYRSVDQSGLQSAPLEDLVRSDKVDNRATLKATSVKVPLYTTPGTRRRGRPPKDRGLSSSVGRFSSVTLSDATPSSTSGIIRKRIGRPPGSKNKPKPDGERGPGRPAKPTLSKVNTRMPLDGVGVVIPSRSPSVAAVSVSYVEDPPTPPERKPPRWKHRPTYPSEVPDTDAFPSFKCLWFNCSANLHNLETLKKHIKKVHGLKAQDPETGQYTCQWDRCNESVNFKDIQSWGAHIDEVHLEKTARELGDGPSTHPSDLLPMSYLTDAAGNQVTPLARTSGTPDPLPLNAGKSPTRAYHRAHGNITPEQKAAAEAASLRTHRLRALENAKEVYLRTIARPDAGLSGADDDDDPEEDDDGPGQRREHAGWSGPKVVLPSFSQIQ